MLLAKSGFWQNLKVQSLMRYRTNFEELSYVTDWEVIFHDFTKYVYLHVVFVYMYMQVNALTCVNADDDDTCSPELGHAGGPCERPTVHHTEG